MAKMKPVTAKKKAPKLYFQKVSSAKDKTNKDTTDHTLFHVRKHY